MIVMRKYRKSQFGVDAIIVGVAIFVFVIVITLTFFYFFKYHITLVIRDQYIWNKVQEVPLSLFSTDIDGESFINKANKAYYGFNDKGEFMGLIKNIINSTIFYDYNVEYRPFAYSVNIFGTTVSEGYVTPSGGCKCDKIIAYGSNIYYYGCSDGCAVDKQGRPCGEKKDATWDDRSSWDTRDDMLCYETNKENTIYEVSYPVPLTFNGTNKLIGNISYKVAEYNV